MRFTESVEILDERARLRKDVELATSKRWRHAVVLPLLALAALALLVCAVVVHTVDKQQRRSSPAEAQPTTAYGIRGAIPPREKTNQTAAALHTAPAGLYSMMTSGTDFIKMTLDPDTNSLSLMAATPEFSSLSIGIALFECAPSRGDRYNYDEENGLLDIITDAPCTRRAFQRASWSLGETRYSAEHDTIHITMTYLVLWSKTVTLHSAGSDASATDDDEGEGAAFESAKEDAVEALTADRAEVAAVLQGGR